MIFIPLGLLLSIMFFVVVYLTYDSHKKVKAWDCIGNMERKKAWAKLRDRGIRLILAFTLLAIVLTAVYLRTKDG
jgi:hypothetical protein